MNNHYTMKDLVGGTITLISDETHGNTCDTTQYSESIGL